MKSLSNWSIIFAVIGTLSFCCSLALPTASELLMISGFGALVIGMLCSFGAMYKNEKGKSKFFGCGCILSFKFHTRLE
jgi:hypothetical protein